MSSNGYYIVGRAVRVSLAVLDHAKTPADPTAVRLLVRSPAGAVTTYEGASVVKDAVGAYHADITLAQEGTWYYRWEGDTPVPGNAEGQMVARRSAVI